MLAMTTERGHLTIGTIATGVEPLTPRHTARAETLATMTATTATGVGEKMRIAMRGDLARRTVHTGTTEIADLGLEIGWKRLIGSTKKAGIDLRTIPIEIAIETITQDAMIPIAVTLAVAAESAHMRGMGRVSVVHQ